MVSPSRLDLSLWPRRTPLPLKVQRADLHSSIWRPSGWNMAHRPLFAMTATVLLGRAEPSTVPEDTAASRSLDIIAYLPIHAGPEVAAVPVVQRWKSGHPREGAKRASSPSREGARWGSLTQLWESGRTPKVLSRQLSHNHKSYQHVLGTLRAWEPEVVLSVKIQPAKSLAPQTRRWFSHLENEDCGGAGEKTQPQESRNIYSASSDPWKEWIISEILLWWFSPENRIFYNVVCLQ